jgi:hypothetical protein
VAITLFGASGTVPEHDIQHHMRADATVAPNVKPG